MLHSNNEVIVIEIYTSSKDSSSKEGKDCYIKYNEKYYMQNIMEKDTLLNQVSKFLDLKLPECLDVTFSMVYLFAC